jgi:hypothetical protein
MSKLIALIDADGILYAAALAGQMTMDGGGEAIALTTVQHVYKDALSRVEAQIEAVEKAMGRDVDDTFICLSDRKNFRYDILKPGMIGSPGQLGYKGSRKATARPVLLDGLRKMFDEESPWKVMLIEGLEADDVAGISAGTLQKAGSTTVIVSPDKDLLGVPGYVLTPHKGTYTLTNVTKEMGDRWHLMQALMGDTCDHYSGCPGWGARKAGDLIDLMDYAQLDPWERWAQFVACFVEQGLTEGDALVQAQVSRILRVDDWDAKKKQPLLFTFPESPDA